MKKHRATKSQIHFILYNNEIINNLWKINNYLYNFHQTLFNPENDCLNISATNLIYQN